MVIAVIKSASQRAFIRCILRAIQSVSSLLSYQLLARNPASIHRGGYLRRIGKINCQFNKLQNLTAHQSPAQSNKIKIILPAKMGGSILS